jgi:pimeloyl-ACP methyl ester carboxylesterase
MQTSTIASSKHFTTNDGVRLHYLDKGIGPPLVLLPGWTQPASGFAAQFEALSNSFRCLALDFRGMASRSGRPTVIACHGSLETALTFSIISV